jgi:hypothetical protein
MVSSLKLPPSSGRPASKVNLKTKHSPDPFTEIFGRQIFGEPRPIAKPRLQRHALTCLVIAIGTTQMGLNPKDNMSLAKKQRAAFYPAVSAWTYLGKALEPRMEMTNLEPDLRNGHDGSRSRNAL